MNKEIAVYDNTVSARTYLSYISESAGGFACIGRDGKLYIRTIGETTVTLPLKFFQNFKWGEKAKITRVSYEDGVQSFKQGDKTGNTIYINQENMFIVDQEQIDNIYNKINGLEVYSFDGDSIIDPALDIGDLLIIDNKKVIYQGSANYGGRWKASISSKIQCKAKEETTTKTPSQKVINRRVQSQINQVEGKIILVTEEQEEQKGKVSSLELDVDTIKGQISTIADVTTIAEGYGKVEFSNVNESEPIVIRIHPTVEDITPLYPGENLFPSNELYPHNREIYFVPEDTTNDVLIYNIPKNLYYFNGVYDEFVLDYENQECYIIHRVGLNENTGDKYKLENTSIEYFEYPKIELEEGNYTITLDVFKNAYIYARLMSKNIYTSQFATKVEMNSQLKQTAEEISTNVNKTLTNYSTTTEMNSSIHQTAEVINSEVRKKVGNNEVISKINQSAESVEIDANRININGVISANGNFKVKTDGTIECTSAKISAKDTGIDSENAGISAKSTNYTGNYYSNGINISNNNVDNADFIYISPRSLTMYDKNRYGFDFSVSQSGEMMWIVKDINGTVLQVSDVLNLWNPGQNTNLMLHTNGAYINGYLIQTATSDKRLKTNITDSKENALNKIMQIQHRAFIWKENGQEQKNGYIAQELEKIDKEFVINENDKYSINLLNLLSTTTKAIQEQQQQIKELKQEIKQLEGE